MGVLHGVVGVLCAVGRRPAGGGAAVCWRRRRSSAFFLIRWEARTAKKAPKKLMGLVERLSCRSILGAGPGEADVGGLGRTRGWG